MTSSSSHDNAAVGAPTSARDTIHEPNVADEKDGTSNGFYQNDMTTPAWSTATGMQEALSASRKRPLADRDTTNGDADDAAEQDDAGDPSQQKNNKKRCDDDDVFADADEDVDVSLLDINNDVVDRAGMVRTSRRVSDGMPPPPPPAGVVSRGSWWSAAKNGATSTSGGFYTISQAWQQQQQQQQQSVTNNVVVSEQQHARDTSPDRRRNTEVSPAVVPPVANNVDANDQNDEATNDIDANDHHDKAMTGSITVTRRKQTIKRLERLVAALADEQERLAKRRIEIRQELSKAQLALETERELLELAMLGTTPQSSSSSLAAGHTPPSHNTDGNEDENFDWINHHGNAAPNVDEVEDGEVLEDGLRTEMAEWRDDEWSPVGSNSPLTLTTCPKLADVTLTARQLDEFWNVPDKVTRGGLLSFVPCLTDATGINRFMHVHVSEMQFLRSRIAGVRSEQTTLGDPDGISVSRLCRSLFQCTVLDANIMNTGEPVPSSRAETGGLTGSHWPAQCVHELDNGKCSDLACCFRHNAPEYRRLEGRVMEEMPLPPLLLSRARVVRQFDAARAFTSWPQLPWWADVSDANETAWNRVDSCSNVEQLMNLIAGLEYARIPLMASALNNEAVDFAQHMGKAILGASLALHAGRYEILAWLKEKCRFGRLSFWELYEQCWEVIEQTSRHHFAHNMQANDVFTINFEAQIMLCRLDVLVRSIHRVCFSTTGFVLESLPKWQDMLLFKPDMPRKGNAVQPNSDDHLYVRFGKTGWAIRDEGPLLAANKKLRWLHGQAIARASALRSAESIKAVHDNVVVPALEMTLSSLLSIRNLSGYKQSEPEVDIGRIQIIMAMGYLVLGSIARVAAECDTAEANCSGAVDEAKAVFKELHELVWKVQLHTNHWSIHLLLSPLFAALVSLASSCRIYHRAQFVIQQVVEHETPTDFKEAALPCRHFSSILWSQLVQLRITLPTIKAAPDLDGQGGDEFANCITSRGVALHYVRGMNDWILVSLLSSCDDTAEDRSEALRVLVQAIREPGRLLESRSLSFENDHFISSLDNPTGRFLVSSLPMSICVAGRAFTKLTLCACALQRLPGTFGVWMATLEYLNLTGNRLTGLPESMCSMPYLQDLRLDLNQLIELPAYFAPPALRYFSAENNVLTNIPSVLGTCQHLETLHLAGNPLLDSFWSVTVQMPGLRSVTPAP